jgi:hypothetical protein
MVSVESAEFRERLAEADAAAAAIAAGEVSPPVVSGSGAGLDIGSDNSTTATVGLYTHENYGLPRNCHW